MISAAAKAEVQTAIIDPRLASLRVDQLLVFEEAFLAIFAKLVMGERLLALPENGTLSPIFDASKGEYTGIISCNNLPQDIQKLPFVLSEWCCHDDVSVNPPGSVCAEFSTGCRDPYKAYMDWCSPVLCHEVQAKTAYLKGMQMMAAIGGIYGIFTLFVVTVVWNCFMLGCSR